MPVSLVALASQEQKDCEFRDSYVPALRFRALTPAYDALVRLTTRKRALLVRHPVALIGKESSA